MRSIWLRRLNNLLCVKSIVTIVLTVVFARLSLAERISNQDFLTVFSVIVAFYFGIQNEKQEELPEKEAEKLSAQKCMVMGISLSGASQRGIQTGRDRQDLKGSQESLALLVLWGPEERKESEESQAKLDPPDSKDSQGREVPQVPGESPGPQALWARCLLWKLEGLSPERPPR